MPSIYGLLSGNYVNFNARVEIFGCLKSLGNSASSEPIKLQNSEKTPHERTQKNGMKTTRVLKLSLLYYVNIRLLPQIHVFSSAMEVNVKFFLNHIFHAVHKILPVHRILPVPKKSSYFSYLLWSLQIIKPI